MILLRRKKEILQICWKEQESIYHILSGSDNLAGREYLERHNNVCRYVHFVIMRHYSVFTQSKNWFEHHPRDAIQVENVELIYDQFIVMDRPCGANRPDILIEDKCAKVGYIIDISCPCDTNIAKKEEEKRREESKINWARCGIEQALGYLLYDNTRCHWWIRSGVKEIHYLKLIFGEPDPSVCQKIVHLGSQKILHSVRSRR